MAWAGDFALDSKRMTQADVQPVRQHNQPRNDFFAVRQRERLPLGAGLDARNLGFDEFDAAGNFTAHRVDEGVVENSVLVAGAMLVEQAAETRNPYTVVERCCTQHGFGQTCLAQNADLMAVEFLAAKIGRVDCVGVDQDRGDACAAKHGRSRRSGQSAANDCNIRLSHETPLFQQRTIATANSTKA